MALIKCEECAREISDKAVSCPYCGCPLTVSNNKNTYNYNGVQYDITNVYYYLSQRNIVKAIKEFREVTNADLTSAKKIVEGLNVPSSASVTKIIQSPKCPNCGSGDFEMIKRNWSPFMGFMTNKVDRVCKACKHKF